MVNIKRVITLFKSSLKRYEKTPNAKDFIRLERYARMLGISEKHPNGIYESNS